MDILLIAGLWLDGAAVWDKVAAGLDIGSGHWPMITAPDELARLLAQATGQS